MEKRIGVKEAEQKASKLLAGGKVKRVVLEKFSIAVDITKEDIDLTRDNIPLISAMVGALS